MEWIKVTERLPNDMEYVIAYDPVKSEEEKESPDVEGVMALYYTKKGGFLYVDEFVRPIPSVTHWMPLPSPPKPEN